MNIKFHTVIRDITGQSGMAVLEAIINGERNAEHFLPLLNYRIKADKETIIKSLEGNWRPEHLFTLKQSVLMYKMYRANIENCKAEMVHYLDRLGAKANEGGAVSKTKRR